MNNLVIDLNKDEGKLFKSFRYPGGEWQVRLTDEGIEKALASPPPVYIIARITDGEVMKLLLLQNALDQLEDGYFYPFVNTILPYFPYSRADRTFVKGDCSGKNTFLSAILGLGGNIITLDVHSNKGTFGSRITNIGPEPIIDRVIEMVPSDTVILLPDEGSRMRYGVKDGTFLGKKVLNCEKKRDPASGVLSGFKVPSLEEFGDSRSVLIIDDICDGGRTFIGIAEKLDESLEKYLYVTHGIFSNGLTLLSSAFRHIFTTDSFRQPEEDNCLTVIPCDPFIMGQLNIRTEV